jgi:hypothetical protein
VLEPVSLPLADPDRVRKYVDAHLTKQATHEDLPRALGPGQENANVKVYKKAVLTSVLVLAEDLRWVSGADYFHTDSDATVGLVGRDQPGGHGIESYPRPPEPLQLSALGSALGTARRGHGKARLSDVSCRTSNRAVRADDWLGRSLTWMISAPAQPAPRGRGYSAAILTPRRPWRHCEGSRALSPHHVPLSSP